MPTYRDGNLQVAISTSGTGPHIAQKLRQHIIENIPKNISNATRNAALLTQLASIEINTHEGGLKLVNGSTAIEHVAYALTSPIFIYPATRSYYLGKLSLYWSSQSLNDAFGEINHVIKADTCFCASTMQFGYPIYFQIEF
ncbi:5057_t:CDS:2 [Entrophospora sp. SA101]|nr:5057_t:CDS:2 [Entrophospora sp. SA101]